MGLIESVKDLFGGGARRCALAGLYHQVHYPGKDNSATLDVVTRFLRIRNCAAIQHRHQYICRIEPHQRNGRDTEYTCSLQRGGNTLYTFFATRNDNRVELFYALKTVLGARDLLNEFQGHLRLDDFIESCVQTMADDSDTRSLLLREMDNGAFCNANFIAAGINPENPNELLVHFKESLLKCSNRIATKGEFRGGNMRDAFYNRKYNSLRELIAPGYLTEEDSLLRYSLMIAQYPLIDFKGGLALPAAALSNEVRTFFHQTVVGNTTLGKCYAIPIPDEIKVNSLTEGERRNEPGHEVHIDNEDYDMLNDIMESGYVAANNNDENFQDISPLAVTAKQSNPETGLSWIIAALNKVIRWQG